jgi:hypothetical protein
MGGCDRDSPRLAMDGQGPGWLRLLMDGWDWSGLVMDVCDRGSRWFVGVVVGRMASAGCGGTSGVVSVLPVRGGGACGRCGVSCAWVDRAGDGRRWVGGEAWTVDNLGAVDNRPAWRAELSVSCAIRRYDPVSAGRSRATNRDLGQRNENVTIDRNACGRSRSVLLQARSRNDWVTRLYAAVALSRPQSTVSPISWRSALGRA